MNKIQSTHAQRKQWRNLQSFNSKKNAELGKPEVHKTDKVTEKDQNFTRVNKSDPVK